MADKNLSTVIGAGGREIGDITTSVAATLTDGKVLLDCDGSAFSAVTYPLLGALWPDNVSGGPTYGYISTDGTSLDDNTSYYDISVKHTFAMSDDGSYVIAWSGDDDLWAQRPADAGEKVARAAQGYVAIASDGVEQIAFELSFSGSPDRMYIHYSTDSGANWSTSVDATGALAGSSAEGGFVAGMNRAGTTARAFMVDGTGYDEWTSGANITTGWTSTNSYTYSTVPGLVSDFDYTDDLACWAVACANGIYMTKDSGVTWTEEKLLPNGAPADRVCVTSTDDLYAMGFVGLQYPASVVYKSTDSGANFTEVLSADEALHALNNPAFTVVAFGSLFSDHNDNLYLLGLATSGQLGGGSINKSTLVIWYSSDDGASWSAGTINVDPPSGSTPDWVIRGNSLRYGMSKDGSILVTGHSNSAIGPYYIDLTVAKHAPVIPGGKLIADAP